MLQSGPSAAHSTLPAKIKKMLHRSLDNHKRSHVEVLFQVHNEATVGLDQNCKHAFLLDEASPAPHI
jgi:hypothetical protein